jgi:siroheme synthase
VGKRCGVKSITQEKINALMIDHARAGSQVVRLKSGDPLIFSRAAEEIAALAEAKISFEIVPGITAAFAAAAAIQCSLTSRTSASSVIFSTGHHARAQNQPQREEATRVVYMPGRELRALAQEWLDKGLPAELPCAIVSRAAQPEERIRRTTLVELGDEQPMLAPSLLIAGWALLESSDPSLLDWGSLQENCFASL